jgi:hypothetical protein
VRSVEPERQRSFRQRRPALKPHELLQGQPDGQIVVTVANVGDAVANGENGSPLTLRISPPPGLRAVSIETETLGKGSSSAENQAEITGRGAAAASITTPIAIGTSPASTSPAVPFGVGHLDQVPEEEPGRSV